MSRQAQELALTPEGRHELCDTDVTLNGEEARITGAERRFATVTQIRTGLGCEWAWGTVARIVASGGAFRSGGVERAANAAPYPAMRHSKGADRPSCLVMNPRNREASAARRVKLLAAFDSLDCNVRADLLELIEQISQNAGERLEERREARGIIKRIYEIAGWE